MAGFGPAAGSEADRTPEQAVVDRDTAAGLYSQAFADGQQSVTADPQAGYDLGFDTGYGARDDHGRTWTRSVLEGHEDGLKARAGLVGAARDGVDARQARDARARIEARQAESAPAQSAGPEQELEAEAG